MMADKHKERAERVCFLIGGAPQELVDRVFEQTALECRQAYAQGVEEAARVVAGERFHVVTQDQVDVLKAARARYIAAIRALLPKDDDGKGTTE